MLPAEEREAYLALSLIPGIGPARLDHLSKVFGSYRGALGAPLGLLRSVPGMSVAAATAVVDRDRTTLGKLLRDSEAVGGRVLLPTDSEFPRSLLTIEDPPVWLFALGRLDLLGTAALAVVGSRHPTGYGIEVTRTVAGTAAQAGITIVSGMARGLDAVAHWAAVEQPGGTVGVLGNGLGVIYPAANERLYTRVAESGLLVTEFPPGERPNAGSFPRRNRLIAALARATLVVEGSVKSGALITADAALNQGKEVFAVPGPVTSRLSEGTNALIRDGATPYLEPADLASCFPELEAYRRPEAAIGVTGQRPRRILEALDGVPRSVDALALELGLAPHEVLGTLSELEVAGLADRGPAGFTRAS